MKNSPREYYGIIIWPAGPNGSGIRWTAMYGGMSLRADTLDGIKRLIRHYVKANNRSC